MYCHLVHRHLWNFNRENIKFFSHDASTIKEALCELLKSPWSWHLTLCWKPKVPSIICNVVFISKSHWEFPSSRIVFIYVLIPSLYTSNLKPLLTFFKFFFLAPGNYIRKIDISGFKLGGQNNRTPTINEE